MTFLPNSNNHNMKSSTLSSRFIITGMSICLCVSCFDKNGTDPDTTPQNSGSFNIKPVDIGLSVKWANANVGAKTESDFGDYFAWGETEANKSTYTWENYKYYDAANNSFTKYYYWILPGGGLGPDDGKTILDPMDDAAHVVLGGSWRMPTYDEMKELSDTQNNPSYSWDLVKIGKENGLKITFKENNNSIVFLIGGYMREYSHNTCYSDDGGFYWSSSISDVLGDENACCFTIVYVESAQINYAVFSALVGSEDRCLGFNIRPVQE